MLGARGRQPGPEPQGQKSSEGPTWKTERTSVRSLGRSVLALVHESVEDVLFDVPQKLEGRVGQRDVHLAPYCHPFIIETATIMVEKKTNERDVPFAKDLLDEVAPGV